MARHSDDPEKPLPRQPETQAPFQLQRPSPEEIAALNDPYGESLGARLIVLNRYIHQVPKYDEARGRDVMTSVPGVYGHYEIHGDSRPSLFRTWHRARAQAIGPAGARPGAILLFDMRAMPCVTSEAEMAQVVKRPIATRVWEQEDEAMFAERMAEAWMRYAKSVGAEMMSGASPNIAADGRYRDSETSSSPPRTTRARSPGRCIDCDPSFGCWSAGPAGDGRNFKDVCQKQPQLLPLYPSKDNSPCIECDDYKQRCWNIPVGEPRRCWRAEKRKATQPQDDGEAGAVDRGNARSPEQDAGL